MFVGRYGIWVRGKLLKQYTIKNSYFPREEKRKVPRKVSIGLYSKYVPVTGSPSNLGEAASFSWAALGPSVTDGS